MMPVASVLRILLIEDNPTDVLLLEESFAGLSETEFEMVHVERLADGLGCLRSHRFDVVLLDLGLPDSQGVETFQRLHQAAPDVPVLVLTALDDDRVGVRAMKEGAQDYLVKRDMQPTLLARSVRFAIERHRYAVELDQRARELAASEERFELAMSGSAAGLWDWNVRTDEVYFSPRFKELIGHDTGEFPNHIDAYLEAIHPDDRSAVKRARENHFERHEPFDVEFRVYAKSRAIRWIQSRGQAVWDERGEVHRMVGWILDVTERKQAAESLRLFRDLLDQSNDGIEVIDPSSARLLDVNERECLDLGFEREELLSRRLFDIDPTVDESMWAKFMTEVESRGAVHGEGLRRRRDGSAFPVEFNARWVHLDRDYLVTVVRDITERKEAEKALRQSERRFRALIESSVDAISVIGADNTISYLSPSIERVEGFKPEELLGRNGLERTHPDDHAKMETYVAELMAKPGEPVAVLWRHRHKDGRWLWLEGVATNHLNDPAIAGIVTNYRDVSDRVEADREIRRQAAILDKASDAIVVRDLNEVVTFWNKGAERLYGWSAKEVVGQDVTTRVFKNPQVHAQASVELRRSGEWSGVMTQIRRDGAELQIQARWTLMRDHEGAPRAILSINTDITAQKKLEAQFLRAQRMESLGTLAGGVAHDFNNVLAPILMSLALLKFRSEDDETRQTLEILESSAHRGKELVKQVLAFGRGVSGERMQIQPRHIVREVVGIAEETFPKKIEVTVSENSGTATIMGDATHLHQVILNLCVNARDAMPSGGRLQIATDRVEFDETTVALNPDARPGPYVLIKVSDTGEGMSEEVRERIFEPFFTTKEVGQGTGLGLSTVLAIVRSHGGFIDVSSDVGRGTTFRAFFPALSDEPSDTGTVAGAALPRGNNELVLVVDDEVAIRSLAARTLERFGYRVCLAANGAEALELYRRRAAEIAVVITDISMPVMDGPTLAGELRKIDPAVIVIGSSGFDAANDSADEQGGIFDRYVAKPYVAERMLAMLRAVLDAPPATEPGD